MISISSLPPISNDSKSQTPIKNRISVLSAINKLKQTQYKIIEAKNKQLRQKRIIQANKAKQKEKQQSQAIKQSIRKSIEVDKSMKEKSILQKNQQQSKLHQLASSLRQTRQHFKQNIKAAFRQTSSQIYSEALSQRLRNQQLIKEFKNRQMLIKQQNRIKMSESMQKSKEKVRDFRESRIGFIKRKREEDVIELERKIMQRSRYLQRLSEEGENLRNTNNNYSSLSRVSQGDNQRSIRLLSHVSNSKKDSEVNRRSKSILLEQSAVDSKNDLNNNSILDVNNRGQRQIQNCEEQSGHENQKKN